MELLGSKFQFGVNLHQSTLMQLDFLETAYNLPQLRQDDVIEWAIWRYEHLWLPLVAKIHKSTGPLPAPLDVEWVWHCHLLSPLDYEKDCIKVTGRMVDHQLFSTQTKEMKLQESQKLWEMIYPKEDFNIIDQLNKTDNKYLGKLPPKKSKISYNLRAALGRQTGFFYAVSLPHFRDKKFLSNALERYSKFLFLRQQFPSVFLVPAYDIDLMWHTHQLHPVMYQKDTKTLLGGVFNHDDSVNERHPGSKLETSFVETKDLWMKAFREPFTIFGSAYRGEPPNGKLQRVNLDLPKRMLKEDYLRKIESHSIHIQRKLVLELTMRSSRYMYSHTSYPLDKETRDRAPPQNTLVLTVIPGTYETCTIPETSEKIWGPVPLARLPPNFVNTCDVASHRLEDHINDLQFTCRTIHSLFLKTSVVQVFYKDKMVVVGHLIGTDQLPLNTQVSMGCPSLQPGVGDRAILIKNTFGDWGIMLGRWQKFHKPVPKTKGYLEMKGIPPGPRMTPGHLRVKLYKMATKQWETIKTNYESFQREVNFNGMDVNLKRGIIITPVADAAENLSVAFGIGLLHVLCEPFVKDRDTEEIASSDRDRQLSSMDPVDMPIILAAGYRASAPSNRFLYFNGGGGGGGDGCGCGGPGGSGSFAGCCDGGDGGGKGDGGGDGDGGGVGGGDGGGEGGRGGGGEGGGGGGGGSAGCGGAGCSRGAGCGAGAGCGGGGGAGCGGRGCAGCVGGGGAGCGGGGGAGCGGADYD